jgi:hypothetical protein
MANEERRMAAKIRPLGDIISTPGFQHIATAIRQSTVTQQYYKVDRDDNTYDVRYGLADELHRHARDNREFIQSLAKFLQEYSQENARVMERNKGKAYRKRIPISTQDIAQVTELVDEHGAATVANLLIAFGYARDPRAADASDAGSDVQPTMEEQTESQDDENPF